MNARMEEESRGALLVVRVVGEVAFDEADFVLAAELTALLARHAGSGGTQVLVDLSRVRYVYGSTFSLHMDPFLNAGTAVLRRTTFVVGANEATRNRFVMTRLVDIFPIFDLEADALRYLESGPSAQGSLEG